MKRKIEACIYCGGIDKDLSVRKICPDCATSRMKESIKQIRAKKGEIYEKWKRNLLASTLGEGE